MPGRGGLVLELSLLQLPLGTMDGCDLGLELVWAESLKELINTLYMHCDVRHENDGILDVEGMSEVFSAVKTKENCSFNMSAFTLG